jgi:hypothetical protein
MSIETRGCSSSPAIIARRIMTLAVLMLALSPAIAEAGFITIDPAGMNAIFSQSSFDGTPVDIRFSPAVTIVDSDLLDINDPAKLAALVALAPDPTPVVDAFFVDQIDACGFEQELTVNGSFAGCAQLPGHVFVEDSEDAVLSPAPLMGHELGHNLDLPHDLFSPEYLMWPFFPPGTLVTDQEVNTILQSPLVQTDPSGQKFIEITPIAIVAAEPPALWLLGTTLALLMVVSMIGRAREPTR